MILSILQNALLSIIVLIAIVEFALMNAREKRLQEEKVSWNRKRKEVFDF
jgi:hypothetical protein